MNHQKLHSTALFSHLPHLISSFTLHVFLCLRPWLCTFSPLAKALPRDTTQMILSLFASFLSRLTSRWPLLFYAVAWTALLTLTVAVASFSPEIAFVNAISPSSSFSTKCGVEGTVRVPVDVPVEILCLPERMLRKSMIDLLVPPIFAAAVVAGSACVVRALGLWEADDYH